MLPSSNAQKYLQANYTAPFASDRKSRKVDDAGGGLVVGRPRRRSKPRPETVPDARTQPIRLTQADLDRIIGNQANTLLQRLQAKTPGVSYGVAVAFASPNHQFNPADDGAGFDDPDHPVVAQPVRRIPARAGEHGAGLAAATRPNPDHLEQTARPLWVAARAGSA